MGVVRSHLHLLIRLHPTTSIPRLLQRMKGGSSAIAMKEGHAPEVLLKSYRLYSGTHLKLDKVRLVRAAKLQADSRMPAGQHEIDRATEHES